MTDVMQGILAEAKKNKFSTIKDNLSEEGKILTTVLTLILITNVVEDELLRSYQNIVTYLKSCHLIGYKHVRIESNRRAVMLNYVKIHS